MKYCNVFIDLDDTLCDTYGATSAALASIHSEFSQAISLGSHDEFCARFWQSNTHVWRQFSMGLMDFDTLSFQRFVPLVGRSLADSVAVRFHQLYMQSLSLLPGAMQLLVQCRQRGQRIFLCTNGAESLQRQKLEICQIEYLFDDVFISESVGAAKPSAEFFAHALMGAQAQSSESVMIGDNYDTDIVGARNVGLATVLFSRWDASFVPPGPVDFVADSLAEVASFVF